MKGRHREREGFLQLASQFLLFGWVLLYATLPPPLSFARDNIYYLTSTISHMGIRRELRTILQLARPLAVLGALFSIFFRPFCLFLALFIVLSRSADFLEPLGFSQRKYPGFSGLTQTLGSQLLDDGVLRDFGLVGTLLHIALR